MWAFLCRYGVKGKISGKREDEGQKGRGGHKMRLQTKSINSEQCGGQLPGRKTDVV